MTMNISISRVRKANEHIVRCKKVSTAINRAQNSLKEKARKYGVYENFGREECKMIRDNFIVGKEYNKDNMQRVERFEEWCCLYR